MNIKTRILQRLAEVQADVEQFEQFGANGFVQMKRETIRQYQIVLARVTSEKRGGIFPQP